MKVAFELTGLTPLLMHADDIMQQDVLNQWRKATENKNVSTPGDDRSPAWTWQSYVYTDGEFIAMQQENIMCCLRSAGAQVILKKQKTFKELTQSGIVIDGEHCELLANGKKVPMSALDDMKSLPFMEQYAAVEKLGFRLWAKRARIGTAKHVRVRPRFENWSVRGSLLVGAKEITFETLKQLFTLAGRIGIGDWRPGCKTPGPYGMFSPKIELMK